MEPALKLHVGSKLFSDFLEGIYVSEPVYSEDYLQEQLNKLSFIPTSLVTKKLKTDVLSSEALANFVPPVRSHEEPNAEFTEQNDLYPEQELEELGLGDILIKPKPRLEVELPKIV